VSDFKTFVDDTKGLLGLVELAADVIDGKASALISVSDKGELKIEKVDKEKEGEK